MLATPQGANSQGSTTDAPISGVGETGFILGFAGLLPQVAAVAALALGVNRDIGHGFAFAYAGLIFSFVGGTWWGLAVRRPGKQGALLVVAVVPSLIVSALMLAMVSSVLPLRPALVILGASLMLMLPVDRHLAMMGDAPAGWMALRKPLSLGLGVLTMIAGALA